jgi:hypothetical protein
MEEVAKLANDSARMATAQRSAIIKLFDETRRRLIETGTRNRLVHVNRANERGNLINIIDESSNAVCEALVSGKVLKFLATNRSKNENSDRPAISDGKKEGVLKQGTTNFAVKTRLTPEGLPKKLGNIAREARTVEEESGVNILYLALGFLLWYEDSSSSIAREAPLVLLPVELVRNEKTSAHDLRVREEDILTNLPLQQRLKEDFGIDLPDIDNMDGVWNITEYFSEIEETISEQKRWKIEPDAIQLGFFSFSKLLMYRDLAVESWPDGALENHELTRRLLFEGFDRETPLFRDGDRLDETLPPEKIFHVVDADASQAKVIEEIRTGRNLVVQGPPGTGKSQTITNIIAAAAKEGKRILFVAEKMAALSVVHSRLVKVGLQDVCLELHSRTVNKKVVFAELARTLGRAGAIPRLPSAPLLLKATRDRLNALAEELHRPVGKTGETPFSVLGRQSRFISAGHPPPSLRTTSVVEMSLEEERRLLDVIRRYGELLAVDAQGAEHPFEGTGNLDLQPVDLVRLGALLEKLTQSVAALAAAVDSVLNALSSKQPVALATIAPLCDVLAHIERMPVGASALARTILSASDLGRLREACTAGIEWRTAYDEMANIVVESAFSSSVIALRSPLIGGSRSFFARLGGAYRAASRELAGVLKTNLPKSASERVRLINKISDVVSRRSAFESDSDYCIRVLGDEWRGDKTDFERVLHVVHWCSQTMSTPINVQHDKMLLLAERPDLVSSMRRALQETETIKPDIQDIMTLLDYDVSILGVSQIDSADLKKIVARLARMRAALDRYTSWADICRLRAELHAAGLQELANWMRRGDMNSEAASIELQFARAEQIWKLALGRSPALGNKGMDNRHDLVDSFKILERQHLKDNVTSILVRHLDQVPQGALGEMKVIRGEIAKKSRHMALRRLFQRAGTAVQRIKPVLLMSPMSVAQFLPPGAISFDLLVIDEASQVRPEDALGAVARAQQIVVVGDKKQLPPSSYFDRVIADEEDEAEGEDDDVSSDPLDGAAKLGSMESLLTLCEARGLGSRMLRWHYRSRDPSLMEVSNREFYQSGLILPPSPLQQDHNYGLRFTQVNGVYDKGGKRDNRKEGEAIVARVIEHARVYPSLSLGIVTFSYAQRNTIAELLEISRRSDATLDAFLQEGQSEDVFVKNIENVQGDERDVILVSVGYGPSVEGGRLTSMTFGPVNGEGGERRLNVLFTRSRVRCEIFASFDPGEIDVSRTTKEGPRILRRFLEFAKSGRLDESSVTGMEPDSLFEEDVANVIRSYSFLADPQVGSAGFRIDLGVRHPKKPGRYILAVECDGATYHSALWARERDRLRQEVLEHLGWRFYRIWSSDWFYNRNAEVERLRAALFDAHEAANRGFQIDGANRERPVVGASADTDAKIIDVPEPVVRQMPAYQRAEFRMNSRKEPHEAPLGTLADLAAKIVFLEGPIHVEEVARRIAASFGKQKAGSRVVSVARSALSQAQLKHTVLMTDGTFWYTKGQSEAPPVRDRSNETGTILKAPYISIMEVSAALRIAREDNAGGDDADLIRSAARLLGFKRVGPDILERITSAL